VHGECAVALTVRTGDGVPAVLKVGWPHWEAEHEHLALRHWDGQGAVRLLRADPRRSALLLERLHRTDLMTVPIIEACEIVAGLYPRLHVAAPPQLYRLSDVSARWSRELLALPADAALPRRYVEQAAGLLADLATDPATDGTLLHTDLHFFNVLAPYRPDRSESWVAIDPKPLAGDPGFELLAALHNRWEDVVATGDVRRAVRRRFDLMTATVGLDRQRATGWTLGRILQNALWDAENADTTVHTEPDRVIASILLGRD